MWVSNMDSEFKSLEDLFKRLKPALYSKVLELKRRGLEYIKEEDIFNYLAQNVWNKKDNLSIGDLTNDILYLDNNLITNYCLNLLKDTERDIKEEETNLL